MPKRVPSVAVVLDRSSPYARDVLAGVLDHARPRGWRLGDETTADTADGVIADAAVPTPAAGRAVRFNLAFAPGGDVCIDTDAVRVLAAEHFRERGFDRPHFDPPTIDGLARPAALFFRTDAAAVAAVNVLRGAGRNVPHDVAVLGHGNDPLACERCDPPLSSVEIDARRIGRIAAVRMARLLAGRAAGDVERVRPLGVVERASTDTLAVHDADLAVAVRFIREHAAGPLRVGDVLRASGLDRRTLERRFDRHFGRSPAEAIRRRRVDTASRMLRETTLPVAEIARRSGFSLGQHLAVAFKAIVGQTPSDYRASAGLVPSPGNPGEGLGGGPRVSMVARKIGRPPP